ncbi:trypsin-like peptidase domain-containing protein [Clostridioides difficile]|uniref:trypsin-like peptidase domain-containing protein n=1 Tax=Clostridioides difficile TaxID=1496 RepID=UPI002AB44167|nr:trypsin-like peptidase domain-containing protein [Clostridioides difficile]MDY7821593.1 YceG family protein [Clostridioides difficile]MDY7838314.1 YceG family protein [Clostridioides difficile]MDY7859573.1 YceG family protein [Clostridioides difficile]
MICTIKPLKISIKKSNEPLIEFMSNTTYQNKSSSYIKEVYFTRYIGVDDSIDKYIKKIKNIDTYFFNNPIIPYIRLSSLNINFDKEQTDKMLKIFNIYDSAKFNSWDLYNINFPCKIENDTLNWTKKIAFKNTLDLFSMSMPNCTPSIIKNFAVKLLCWIEYFLPKLFYNKVNTNISPKILYFGNIKRQELFFLYFLSQLGCDILYINPNKDILDLYPECSKFSNIFELSRKTPNILEIPFERHIANINYNENTNKTSHPMNKPNSENTFNNTNLISKKIVQGEEVELSYEELAKLSASVVMIVVCNKENKPFKSGSGVVINNEGYILTNLHVVNDGYSFLVRFENDDKVYTSYQIIKYHSGYDLAVIKVDRKCKPIPVKIGKKPVRGQKIVAIGSPLGLFNTVSDGIISAFRDFETVQMIQFTAPISSGSSGGALLDMFGNLLGLISAGYDDGQNLNLAVESSLVKIFANNFIEIVN